MTPLQGIIVGIIQGLTEFLPVSSSGHLVFVPKLLGFSSYLVFDVLLHFATALAVILYFWKDLYEIIKSFLRAIWLVSLGENSFQEIYQQDVPFRIGCLMLLGTIPTAFIGLTFRDFFESLFSSLLAVGIFLIVTGIIMWLAEYFSVPKKGIKGIGVLDVLLIGLAQGCAIAPGLSRSGVTVSSALLRGFERGVAAEFSFLLSIPAILGATLLESKDIFDMGIFGGNMWPMLLGALAAFISAYIAIRFFIGMIRKTSLEYFSYYCWLVGGALIIWQLLVGF